MIVTNSMLEHFLFSLKKLCDTRIKVEEKLDFFLYMISHNASFEDLQEEFGHSSDTFHHHIKHFFDIVVPSLAKQFLKPPSPIQVHPKIERNPRFYPYFKVMAFLSLPNIYSFSSKF
jgi:hypothetical protein